MFSPFVNQKGIKLVTIGKCPLADVSGFKMDVLQICKRRLNVNGQNFCNIFISYSDSSQSFFFFFFF